MNEHPVSLYVTDDLRRSRLTVFFRPLLFIPHYIWLYLWSIVAAIVLVLNWLVALVIGRPAKPFQRFLGAYLRYSTTVFAYLFLIGNPFPGFTGERGSYPIELEVPTEPEKQNRLVTFFRILLVLPAALVSGGLLYVTYLTTFLAWWAALITGRMPRGFRDLGANALRYMGQVNSYTYLVTGRYPSASPYVGMVVPQAVAAPAEQPESNKE
jgi:hypothetical protein